MNKPCRVCGTPQPKAICEACKQSAQRQRPSRQQRGYDTQYERNRRDMIARAWARGEPCVICARGFASKSDITAEHLDPLRDGGSSDLANLGPSHLACNSAWRRKPR